MDRIICGFVTRNRFGFICRFVSWLGSISFGWLLASRLHCRLLFSLLFWFRRSILWLGSSILFLWFGILFRWFSGVCIYRLLSVLFLLFVLSFWILWNRLSSKSFIPISWSEGSDGFNRLLSHFLCRCWILFWSWILLWCWNRLILTRGCLLCLVLAFFLVVSNLLFTRNQSCIKFLLVSEFLKLFIVKIDHDFVGVDAKEFSQIFRAIHYELVVFPLLVDLVSLQVLQRNHVVTL